MTLRAIWSHVENPLAYFITEGQRIHWSYLFFAFAIGLVAYLRSNSGRSSLRDFLKYAFPRSVYLDRSALLDYRYFLVNKALFGVLFLPALAVIIPVVNGIVLTGLRATIPGLQDIAASTTWMVAALTVCAVLAADFGTFFMHYLQHRIPVLWEFHKVHHSAQVLTPITVYRMHPVDDVMTMLASGIGIATIAAIFDFFTIGRLSIWSVFGLNVFVYAFYLLGYNLRHSHLWLSYGPVVSQILISPAQHQIHHSREQRHYDRNFGLIFAFWDKLFGSLYTPRGFEAIEFGLAEREDEEYSSVGRLYFLPFRKAFGLGGRRALIGAGIVTVSLLSLTASTASVIAGESRSDSVQLEDLTWVEVNGMISRGMRTVLIPTAGNEQNGPHVILGKHHYIVRHTSEAIARELGNALVAPVVTYVPEGEIEPAAGHMRYAGTLSLPPEVFESLLENAARSLKAHGFRLICLIGDSGDSQQSQARVADRLNAEWASEDTRVLHVAAYYSDNGQMEWLEDQGIPQKEVGSHAGVRDTSELIYVHPDGVRMEKLVVGAHNAAQGVNGDPTRASAELGRTMVDLKVRAAVEEIRRFANASQ